MESDQAPALLIHSQIRKDRLAMTPFTELSARAAGRVYLRAIHQNETGQSSRSAHRVPFKVLIDYLEGGETLDQFLEQYPSVSRQLAVAATEELRRRPPG